MTLAEATRQYQVALEHYRRDPEEHEEELEQASLQMNALWVVHEAEEALRAG